MGHACAMETAIVMPQRPDLVDKSRMQRGGQAAEDGFRTIDMLKGQPFFMIDEFDEFSDNGAIGMPEFATPEKGERFLDAAAQGVARLLDEFETWTFQTRERKS